MVGKPLFILNNNIHSLPEKDDWRGKGAICGWTHGVMIGIMSQRIISFGIPKKMIIIINFIWIWEVAIPAGDII